MKREIYSPPRCWRDYRVFVIPVALRTITNLL